MLIICIIRVTIVIRTSISTMVIINIVRAHIVSVRVISIIILSVRIGVTRVITAIVILSIIGEHQPPHNKLFHIPCNSHCRHLNYRHHCLHAPYNKCILCQWGNHPHLQFYVPHSQGHQTSHRTGVLQNWTIYLPLPHHQQHRGLIPPSSPQVHFQ